MGKDQDQGKATLVSLLGIEAARQKAGALATQAVDRLSLYGAEAAELRALPIFLLNRES